MNKASSSAFQASRQPVDGLSAEHVAKALGGATKGSNGWWNCRCPAHDDRNPSLGLHDTEDGGISYNCLAGCTSTAIGAALEARGLLPRKPERKAFTANGKGKLGRIVATYDYVDEHGELLFQVVRFEPKNFRQRRPDEKGGWAWSLGDTRRALYHLPELLAADPAETVFVVEGERDADRLRALGLVATTNPQGAGKWTKADRDALTGRRVVILPDNDQSGRDHARDIVRDLTRKAASVRVLELPGLPEKGDVSDWLDAGGTVEELRRLAAEVPEATAKDEPRPKLELIGGNRRDVLETIERKLREPGSVKPGWIFARGMAPAVLRYSADATKLRFGKMEIVLPARTAYLAAAKPEHVAALLDSLFHFVRLKRDRNGDPCEVSCDCPLDLARHVLANANLLPLLAISRAPVLRRDGSVLDRPGYDAATGIYYAPEIEFPAIPARPTQDDAKAAMARLLRPFRGFPFTTEIDRHAVGAEVLTLLTRHLVPRAPAFLHNATEAGSGKTKLFETVALLALGANATLHNAEILEDEAELKKVLTTLTLSAVPLVIFDNVERGGEIASPGIANFLTATVYGDRLLGTNEEVKAATGTVVGITGNGCEIVGDNTRRILRIDLDAGVERPELREFDFDCETEAREGRAELVVAALTVLRAHALAGWPKVPGRGALGSYEDWDRLVCGALAFAGAGDVCSLLEKTRTVDPERGRLVELLNVLVGIGATGVGMKAGEIIRIAEETLRQRTGKEERQEAEGWLEVLGRFGKDGKPSAVTLGRYLTKNSGRVVDGMTLIADFDSHTKASAFRVKITRDKPETRANTEDQPKGEPVAPAGGANGFAGDAGDSGGYSRLSLRDMQGQRDAYICIGDRPQHPPLSPASPADDESGWEGAL